MKEEDVAVSIGVLQEQVRCLSDAIDKGFNEIKQSYSAKIETLERKVARLEKNWAVIAVISSIVGSVFFTVLGKFI
jgi:tRNA A-37 threonylcarbamoyl transferase component Bud32